MNTTLNLVPTDNNNLVLQGFLTLNQVCALLTIGKSTFYRGMQKGIYPKPYSITGYRKAWAADEIFEVINQIKLQQRT